VPEITAVGHYKTGIAGEVYDHTRRVSATDNEWYPPPAKGSARIRQPVQEKRVVALVRPGIGRGQDKESNQGFLELIRLFNGILEGMVAGGSDRGLKPEDYIRAILNPVGIQGLDS
jgi:hypothetical protein